MPTPPNIRRATADDAPAITMRDPTAQLTQRCRAALVACTLTFLAAAPGAGQELPDSVARLNTAGHWLQALDLAFARPAMVAALDQPAFCRLELQKLLAYDRLGRLETGAARIKQFDDSCRDQRLAPGDTQLLRTLRRDFILPAIPATGLDFSGIDRFWQVVDTLTADREPSEALWHRMFTTPGYRFSFFNVQPLRIDLELAFRPSRMRERDSILAGTDDNAARLSHLRSAIRLRAELERFRDSLQRSDVGHRALAIAASFLPPGITQGTTPPFVAFAIFREDAYSTGPRTVCVDLIRAAEGGLDLLLAHEFHHSYLSTVSQVSRVPVDSADALLVNSLNNLRTEGLADLIDKPAFLAAPPAALASYAARYLRERDSALVTLGRIDMILTHAGRDSTSLRDAGRRVSALLWSAGHPVGGYMARRIFDTFGNDSILPGVRSPFAFVRTYIAAERAHGTASPFSDQTNAFLAWEEQRYTRH